FHGRLMSMGFDNRGVKAFYAEAKAKDYFGKNAYTMANDREFFAVTASIFLAGKESMHEPKSRDKLREKMPDYYKYLVRGFGFDPEPVPARTPVAAAN